MDTVLVTGGAGFIGSHFVKRLLRADDITAVTVLDALTYAGHVENLGEAFLSPKLTFIEGNVLDARLVDELVDSHGAIVHFAAESHVDRSFFQAGNFLKTNVLGTNVLLDAAKRSGVEKFVLVSTDEVYGPMEFGSASETEPIRATVPYAASKAASELVALSYFRSYGVPVCVTRSSNNYGPCQHPEKIIPAFVTRLLKGEPIHLHGHGEHVRDWLHVEDNCQGIELVLRAGLPGEIYNIGGGSEMTNTELTEIILRVCEAGWESVRYVPDRQVNDIRYSMNWSKIARELGYGPRRSLDDGLAQTAEWYRSNPSRWAPLLRSSHGSPAAATVTGATT